MKYFTLSALLFFFTASTFAQTKIYFDKDWNKTDAANAAYYRTIKKKKEFFVIQDFYISGKLQFKGFSTSSTEPLQYEGTCLWYHENGKLAQKVNYKDHKKHGEATYYFSNGNVKAKGFYTNDYADGLFSEYFPSGGLALRGSFVMNVMNGEMVKYDYRGRLEEKFHYKNGKEYGTYEKHVDGRLLYKGNAINGRQDGFCEEYFYVTGKVYRSYTIKNGKLDGMLKQYDAYGEQNLEIVFDNGIPQSYKLDSRKDYKFRYINTMKLQDGIEHWFFTEDGNPYLKSFYKNGKRTGIWEVYDELSHKLVLKIDYTNAEGCDERYKQGTEEEFTANLFLSNRFVSMKNFFSLPCKNVKFTVLEDSDTTQTALSEYEYIMDEQETEESEEVEESVEETIIESLLDPDDPECKKYKDYIYTHQCVLVKNDIQYNIFRGIDSKSLKIINSQDKPNDRQLYFFYHNPYNTSENPVEFTAFSIPKKLKKQIRKGSISKEHIVETIIEVDNYMPLEKEDIMRALISALNE